MLESKWEEFVSRVKVLGLTELVKPFTGQKDFESSNGKGVAVRP